MNMAISVPQNDIYVANFVLKTRNKIIFMLLTLLFFLFFFLIEIELH